MTMKNVKLIITTDNSDYSDFMVRFITDGMLGRLARWLRLLGYDTVFQPDRSKEELSLLAACENRVFLTRDRNFTERSWPFQTVYIFTEDPKEQLKQVVNDFSLDSVSYRFSLCSMCNVPVERVEKKKIAESVPLSILERENIFWKCPSCGRVYWKGGHWKRIEEWLSGLDLSSH